ncbi:hypothetical protein AGR4C_Cc80304 [Agrobacterium tumefaciens str. Kerr 14]|uniref:Uncharacterized protein n=1 Tax=Agrobacterium tumefaciens str. Kerr 14 TaxID=1183424 RepID=A0A1S7QNT1_AGRTU|nr:hypothetical protein AGR4C_Cc80304 [Agrobacterium tumefaciens str. Kerr 14]
MRSSERKSVRFVRLLADKVDLANA